MATRPLARLLGENADLEPVRDRLAEVTLLQERFRLVAPATLSQACRVCAVDGSTVVVRADNAPVAAALRAMAPRLLAALLEPAAGKKSLKNNREGKLTGLRVELQVAVPPRKPAPVARGVLPREALAALAGSMSDSPLKDALDRIATGQRKSSTRSKR
jgi:Dna[CI] antecedent, DciA